jgi:hypothetical protein
VGEGVEYVGDRDDARRERYGLGVDPARVAGAIPALVVTQGDLLGHLQQREVASGKHGRSDTRVGLHPLELLPRQPPAFEQNAVGDADLSDVVKGRSLTEKEKLLLGQVKGGTDQLGQAAHAPGVLPGVVIAVLGRDCEALDDEQLRVLQQQARVLASESLRGCMSSPFAAVEDAEQPDQEADHDGGALGRQAL